MVGDRRRAEATTAGDREDAGADDFWSDGVLHTEENAQALDRIIDEQHDEDAAARATRSYMGTPTGDEERDELASWATAKACQGCRRTLDRTGEIESVQHDDCRTALRAARVLARDG